MNVHPGVGVTAAGLNKLQEAVSGQEGGGRVVPVAGGALQTVHRVPPLSAHSPVHTMSMSTGKQKSLDLADLE